MNRKEDFKREIHNDGPFYTSFFVYEDSQKERNSAPDAGLHLVLHVPSDISFHFIPFHFISEKNMIEDLVFF